MPRWRVVVHALDRTGPPILALSLVRWLSDNTSDDVDVVAFRGGELIDEFVSSAANTTVAMDPSEPSFTGAAAAQRRAERASRLVHLGPADATLLVSVSASQALPMLPPGGGPVLTWAVEQGEDLHWLDGEADLLTITDRWLAGSEGTRLQLLQRINAAANIHVCHEFVDVPVVDSHLVKRCRATLGATTTDFLVLGAGIGTQRKGVDLFVELALAAVRMRARHMRFAWIGGHRDPFYWRARSVAQYLGLTNLRWFETVADVGPWIAAGDAFAQVARLDAFPLVCLHAATVGTPVVAFSGAGGAQEMFGSAFIGAPYPDVGGLFQRLHELVEPDARRAAAERQWSSIATRHLTSVGAPLVRDQLVRAARPSRLRNARQGIDEP